MLLTQKRLHQHIAVICADVDARLPCMTGQPYNMCASAIAASLKPLAIRLVKIMLISSRDLHFDLTTVLADRRQISLTQVTAYHHHNNELSSPSSQAN